MPANALHAFLSCLPFLASLRVLHLAEIGLERKFDDFLAIFPSLAPKLQSLALAANTFDLPQWTAFAPLLSQCHCLSKLNLREMRLDNELWPVVAPVLLHFPSLTSLTLSYNPLGAGRRLPADSTHSCASILASVLASLPALQELLLVSCEFDSTHLIILSEAFPSLPLLSSLDLTNLYLDDSVVEPLIVSLLHLEDLRSLDLRSRFLRVSASSEAHLRRALKPNFFVFNSIRLHLDIERR